MANASAWARLRDLQRRAGVSNEPDVEVIFRTIVNQTWIDDDHTRPAGIKIFGIDCLPLPGYERKWPPCSIEFDSPLGRDELPEPWCTWLAGGEPPITFTLDGPIPDDTA